MIWLVCRTKQWFLMYQPLFACWSSRNPTYTDCKGILRLTTSIMNMGKQGLYTSKSLAKAYSHFQTTTFVLSVYNLWSFLLSNKLLIYCIDLNVTWALDSSLTSMNWSFSGSKWTTHPGTDREWIQTGMPWRRPAECVQYNEKLLAVSVSIVHQRSKVIPPVTAGRP